MAANGKVTIGFSKPYVAKYSYADSAVTYTDCQILARGVSVSMTAETNDDNNFYADNAIAETEAGTFVNGTVTLEVDGLFKTAENFIYGLPTEDENGWTNYGDEMAIPYVGVGYIIKYMSDGETIYTPMVLNKCRFAVHEDAATTQGDSIDWQTTSLEANVIKDDLGNWKALGKDYATEAEAEAALKTKLGVTETAKKTAAKKTEA